MILLIDNYDSFVYNLARYCEVLGFHTRVVRNDAVTLNEIEKFNPSHILISPGPCTPKEAGISIEVITHFSSKVPILGVCLGHQAIAEAYGAKITRAKKPTHGKSSHIAHEEKGIFLNLPNPLEVGRYHSLSVSREDFPKTLRITAQDETGEIMAIAHRHFPLVGVQFHPESVLTPQGNHLLENFLGEDQCP